MQAFKRLRYCHFTGFQRSLRHTATFITRTVASLAKGLSEVPPAIVRKDLEEIFQHKVFKMLLSYRKISEDLVSMLMSWRHSGFNLFSGSRAYPRAETAIENLARHIIWTSFSPQRMIYVEEEPQVLYRSKDGKEEKLFDRTFRDVFKSNLI